MQFLPLRQAPAQRRKSPLSTEMANAIMIRFLPALSHHHRSLRQSSSAFRFTAAQAGFFDL